MKGQFLAENVVAWDDVMTLERGVRYALGPLGAVGAGGFGSVYRVDEQAGWPIERGVMALKCSNVGFPAEDLELPFREDGRTARALLRRAFLVEWREYCQTAGADGHVPRPHAFGILVDEANTTAFYAILMDWIDGTGFEEAASIASKDGMGGLSARQTMRWGILLCEALWSLHRRNVVHRDLYPSNIKVRMGIDCRIAECMYLLDLGQSASPSDVATPSGGMQRLAQLHYGAPEMFLTPGDPYYDDRNDPSVDVWSLGALLYHMRTGEVPLVALERFSGRLYLTQQDAREIAAIKQGGVTLGPSWSEPHDKVLRHLIADCTQADPAMRPSVKAVWRTLDQALHAEESVSSPELPSEQEVTPTPVVTWDEEGDGDWTPAPSGVDMPGAGDEPTPPPAPRDGQQMGERTPWGELPVRDDRIPIFLTAGQRDEYLTVMESEGAERATRAADYYALEPSPNARKVSMAFRKVAADRGDARSCVVYGHALFHGIDGVTSDVIGAYGYLSRGRDLGVSGRLLARACYDLGLAHRYGLGTPRAFPDALRLFERASGMGYADATYELALMYREGAGVRADSARVLALMRDAARTGSQQAVEWLNAHEEWVYTSMEDVPVEEKPVEDDSVDEACGDDAGVKEGAAVAPSYFTAEQSDEYRAAMAAAEVDRAVRAADYYAAGSASNSRKVSMVFRKIAADRGHAPSCIAYGHALMHGADGVAANPQDAVRYLQVGVANCPSNRVLAGGAFDLGLAYRYGLGTSRLFSEALWLFGRASSLGHADATYELALMHWEGAGVRTDNDHAMELMRDAARMGSEQAVTWLTAHGEPQDTKKEWSWGKRIAVLLLIFLVLVIFLAIV